MLNKSKYIWYLRFFTVATLWMMTAWLTFGILSANFMRSGFFFTQLYNNCVIPMVWERVCVQRHATPCEIHSCVCLSIYITCVPHHQNKYRQLVQVCVYMPVNESILQGTDLHHNGRQRDRPTDRSRADSSGINALRRGTTKALWPDWVASFLCSDCC